MASPMSVVRQTFTAATAPTTIGPRSAPATATSQSAT